MKKTTLFLLALAATALSSVGAHELANRCDPTVRADRQIESIAATESCTQPCMSCNYDHA